MKSHKVLASLLVLFLLVYTLPGAPIIAAPHSAPGIPVGEQRGKETSYLSTLANALNVELVGQIGGGTWAVAVQGQYAYIGVGPRLVILNISNSAKPTVVGQSEVLPDIVRGMVVSGNYAYIADGWYGLRIINVADPAHPAEVSSYDTPGWARGVAVSGNYAYVAEEDIGLRVINVADPAHPAEVGYYDTLGYAQSVTVSGSYAYVADGDRGLCIINVADPEHPAEVGSYDTPGEAWGVAVSGSYAYIADRWGGLRIISIADPAHPADVGYYDTPGSALGVAVSGNYAYVADWDGGLVILRFKGTGTPLKKIYLPLVLRNR